MTQIIFVNKLGIGIVGFFGGGHLGDALWFMANDYLPKLSGFG